MGQLLLDVAFRLLKCVDIAYISVVYFLLAFVLSVCVDRYAMGVFDAALEAKKSTFRMFVEMAGYAAFYGVLVYLVRNFMEVALPSPLEGILGFRQKRVKELTNAMIFGLVFILLQLNLRAKMSALYDRVTSKTRRVVD